MAYTAINRVLKIDDAIIAKAKDVMAYAIFHRETLPQIKDRESVNSPGPADDKNQIMFIPNGFRVVYNVEQHPMDGWCAHISVAVDNSTLWPSPKAVQEILLRCFGIRWNASAKTPVEKDRWDMPVRISGQMVNLVNLRFAINLGETLSASAAPY